MKLSDAVDQWTLNEVLANNLVKEGVQSFFPIQKEVIPVLLRQNSFKCVQPRDICVSAPTGSGKSLAFTVPVVNSLAQETTTRLRAIIILPGRELAKQIFDLFVRLCNGLDLTVALASGQQSFEYEQEILVGKDSIYHGSSKFFDNPADKTPIEIITRNLYAPSLYSEGNSKADILICTPGRLLEHIHSTPGFTLQHVRFLVLDEADRLLGNAYHGWVRSLVNSAGSKERSIYYSEAISGNEDTSIVIPRPSIQRLLFSATLTNNPSKLAMLGIYNPLLIRTLNADAPLAHEDLKSSNDFTLPSTLSEAKVICDTENRPLELVALLKEIFTEPLITTQSEHNEVSYRFAHRGICTNSEKDVCIIFTSSVESAHRLFKLLQIVNGEADELDNRKRKRGVSSYLFGGCVSEMSRLVSTEVRDSIISSCASGITRILIATDNMARGIDLPNVKIVINYDPPKFAKVYVHRVGRTARANNTGHCVTMLKIGQVGSFNKLRESISGGVLGSDHGGKNIGKSMSKANISSATKESMSDVYHNALKKLPLLLEDT